MIAGAVVVVARHRRRLLLHARQGGDQASAAFGAAMLIEQSQVVPAPTLPGATQQAGTFPTEQARNEAALTAFRKWSTRIRTTTPGLAARYQLAGLHLLAAGPRRRGRDAVCRVATNARLVALRPDGAARPGAGAGGRSASSTTRSKILTDLSAQRDGALPMDGVLMELARVSGKAGKTQEARAAFKRVVDEFPQSGYAGEARQQLRDG